MYWGWDILIAWALFSPIAGFIAGHYFGYRPPESPIPEETESQPNIEPVPIKNRGPAPILHYGFTLPDDGGKMKLTGETIPLGGNLKQIIAKKQTKTGKPYGAMRI